MRQTNLSSFPLSKCDLVHLRKTGSAIIDKLISKFLNCNFIRWLINGQFYF